MRVGIGIILSLLSSSVLAAVIPNYDSHGILLARRAVNPDPMDILWKRADEKQTGPVPSSSRSGASTEASAGFSAGSSAGASTGASASAGSSTGAGASASAEASANSGGNSGLSKMSQLREYIEKLYKNHKAKWNTRKQMAALKKDEKMIKNAIKKLTEITGGVSKDRFILEVGKFLTTALGSARSNFELYNNETVVPFLLLVPKGKDQRSLRREMVSIQNTGKKITKKHLGYVLQSINDIIKNSQRVIEELEEILDSIKAMCVAFRLVSVRRYKELASKVGHKENEENIKVTQTYMLQMKNHRDSAFGVINAIRGNVGIGKVTLKVRAPSKLANFKMGVQRRLGLKSTSSTGRVLSPEETGQGPSDQNTSNPKPPGQGPSNHGPPDQGPSKQEPSDEKPSNEKPSDQNTSDENTSKQEESAQRPSDQKPSDQGPSKQEPSDEKPSDQNTSDENTSKQEESNRGPPGQQALDQGKRPPISKPLWLNPNRQTPRV